MLPFIFSWLELILLLVRGLEPWTLRCQSLLEIATGRLSSYQLLVAFVHKPAFIHQGSKISYLHGSHYCKNILSQSAFKFNTFPYFIRIPLIDSGELAQLFKLGYILRSAPISLPELHKFQVLSISDKSREILLIKCLFKHFPSDINLRIFQQSPYAIPPKFGVHF